jgi:hypothetical protein
MYARPLYEIVAELNAQLRCDPAAADRLTLVSIWDVERFSEMIAAVSTAEWNSFVDWVGEQSILDENLFMDKQFEKYLESEEVP